MSRRRTFDYDEALRRYQAGERVVDLAADYGVSSTAVYLAINPEYRARMAARAAANAMSATCVDCGKRCAKYCTGEGVKKEPRCWVCASKARTTTARDGELQCQGCKQWKPDDAFPHSRVQKHGRRGRHKTCRVCCTEQRRAYRERHKIPCVNCGQPRLPANEIAGERRGLRDTGLCRKCWAASLRKAAA